MRSSPRTSVTASASVAAGIALALMAAVVSALHRKLVRDLLRLKGQVLTIALVVAAGIASFVALQGNYASLERARLAFYDRQHFADVFAALERAPHSLEAEIESIPGVEVVQTRVVQPITLPETNVPEPIRATLVALPKEGDEKLNAVALRAGRRPDPNRADEVLVLHDFARAVVSAILTGLVVRRRIDRLDLISVLKTRE